MKLLHLYSGNLYGGIERLLGALNRLQSAYPDLTHSYGLSFRGKLWDELSRDGARVHDLGNVRARYPWSVLRARRRLSKALQADRPDVVICHTPWPHAIYGGMLRRANVRFATYFHDQPHESNPLDRWAARTPADCSIANSAHTASRIAPLFSAPRVQIVYCPSEPSTTELNAAERDRFRQSLDANALDVVFLQAGRFERWKGLHIFMESLVLLKDVPGWKAWIGGEPQKSGEFTYLSELQALATHGGISERVRFIGWRSDMSKVMQAADVFCQPNTGPEPFGLVFTEALAHGLPVIATTLGGALEIVTRECGILVAPGDAKAVASSLLDLLQDPALRARLAKHGPQRARQLVDPVTQLAALHRVLGRLEHT